MYYESFPAKLKKARENIGFTQKDVENELGIKQPTLACWETGRAQPDLESLGLLADFYGVSVDWLLGTKGNVNPNPITINALNSAMAVFEAYKKQTALTQEEIDNINKYGPKGGRF